MTTNEKRREVAARLRESAGLPSRLPNYSIEVKSALVLSKLLDCIDCSDDVFLRLADLIDRPTCRNVYNEICDEYEGGRCKNGFKCSECGEIVEDYEGYRITGTFNCCPKCEREVVD